MTHFPPPWQTPAKMNIGRWFEVVLLVAMTVLLLMGGTDAQRKGGGRRRGNRRGNKHPGLPKVINKASDAYYNHKDVGF